MIVLPLTRCGSAVAVLLAGSFLAVLVLGISGCDEQARDGNRAAALRVAEVVREEVYAAGSIDPDAIASAVAVMLSQLTNPRYPHKDTVGDISNLERNSIVLHYRDDEFWIEYQGNHGRGCIHVEGAEATSWPGEVPGTAEIVSIYK